MKRLWLKKLAPSAAPETLGGEPGSDILGLVDPAMLDLMTVHLVRRMQASHLRGLAICAASENVGASLVSVHLGIAAAQAGLRTLLVDADLRTPPSRKLLPLRSSGLSEWLSSEESAAPSPEPVTLNFDWLPSGAQTNDAGEQLAGDRCRKLMERLLREYELVIVDTPAANRWADTLALSRFVGAAVIVARRDKSLVDDISVLHGELAVEGVHVLGTILNKG